MLPRVRRCYQLNPATGLHDLRRFDDAIDDLDPYPDTPFGCVGLKDTAFVAPGRCGFDTRGDINNDPERPVGYG